MSKPRLAVFRHWVVPLSETFVVNPLREMQSHSVRLFGMNGVGGIELTDIDHWVADDSSDRKSVDQLRYKLCRRSRRLEAAITEFRPHIIMVHFATDVLPVLRVAKRLGVPVAVVSHGSDVLLQQDQALRGSRSERLMVKNWEKIIQEVTMFLPVSGFVAAKLLGMGVNPSRITVYRIGVQIPPLGAYPKDIDVLFVGRLIANKGCQYLLQAVARASELPRRVVIVGDGPEGPALKRFAEDQISSRTEVAFTGSLPFDEVSELMERSRLVCCPSVPLSSGVSEGLNMVALEAQARGVPVLVTETGGLPETVLPNETGLVVPPKDSTALSQAMERLLTDPTLERRLGEQARRHVLTHYNLKTQTERLEQWLAGWSKQSAL